MAAGQVTTITVATNTESCFTCDWRTHVDLVDATGFEFVHHAFVDHGASLDDNFTRRFVYRIGSQHPAQNAFT